MATFKKGVFVDFVGMNTLISDPISASINTIGFAPQLNGQDQPRNIPPEDLVIPSGDLAGGLSGLLPSQGGHIKRYLNISVAHLPSLRRLVTSASTSASPFAIKSLISLFLLTFIEMAHMDIVLGNKSEQQIIPYRDFTIEIAI